MFLFRFFWFIFSGIFKVLAIVGVCFMLLTYTNDATAEVKSYIGDVKSKVSDIEFKEVKKVALKNLAGFLGSALESVKELAERELAEDSTADSEQKA